MKPRLLKAADALLKSIPLGEALLGFDLHKDFAALQRARRIEDFQEARAQLNWDCAQSAAGLASTGVFLGGLLLTGNHHPIGGDAVIAGGLALHALAGFAGEFASERIRVPVERAVDRLFQQGR